MTDYVFDIETYPNVFTISVKSAGQPDRWVFEISTRRNDYPAFMRFIAYLIASAGRLVGFNNLGFDWPVVDFIINSSDCTPASIYLKAQSIIQAEDSDERFNNIIWNPLIPQIDLYKIHHFDNQARRTSLKALEFNMRSDSIEDLPFSVGSWLTNLQIDQLISYNMHDVEETEKFYFKSTEAIRFREELSVKYNRNFLNHNDTKIGKDYMIMEMERIVPGSCYLPGTRTPRQTIRQSIRLADVIFPYVRFIRPEFIRVQQWLAAQVITETKGVFKDLSAIINGFQFDFGTGGIHGSVSSRTVRSDENHAILDIDVTSLYPSLGIVNRLYPAHLGEIFCDVYAEVKKQRMSYPKGSAINEMLKLALNGVYGDSNNRYSVFYDPQYTMAITINGQLLLCMLADYLMYIPNLEMIQINTDGITVRLPRCTVDMFDHFCRWWEGVTGLQLEQVEYSAMYIRDVNSYIAVGLDGKPKRKGAYEYNIDKPGAKYNLGWHQDHSALVIPKAAEAALLHGVPVADYIRSHHDPLDFMCRAKIPRTSRLMIGDRQVQNVTRYFVSTNGASMVKIMPPLAKVPGKERSIGIAVGWLVTECNRLPADLTGFWQSVDYNYYITEAEKLVKPLI